MRRARAPAHAAVESGPLRRAPPASHVSPALDDLSTPSSGSAVPSPPAPFLTPPPLSPPPPPPPAPSNYAPYLHVGATRGGAGGPRFPGVPRDRGNGGNKDDGGRHGDGGEYGGGLGGVRFSGSEGGVNDIDGGAGDLLYVEDRSSPRESLTMPEAVAAAKAKVRKRWSFQARGKGLGLTAGEGATTGGERSADAVDGSFRSRSRTRSRSGSRSRSRSSREMGSSEFGGVFGHHEPPDFPSATTASSSTSYVQSPKEGQIDVKVRTWVLEGNGSGLRKSGKFVTWKKKVEPLKTVRVEANPAGLAPTVLYASDQLRKNPLAEPYKATEFITASPKYVDKESLVFRDSPFEIGVIGMSVTSFDFSIAGDDNELLMFSMQCEPGETGVENNSLPFIHYDPTKDERHHGTEPDQFIPIPASRSLFMASDGQVDADMLRKSVNCRFKILELDKVDEVMSMSLTGIEDLGCHVAQFSAAAPLLGLLSPAFALAGAVSRRALESHAKPDKVITIDMNFLLAERRGGARNPISGDEIPFEQRSGEYLRYGYYFFLGKAVDAKLYASFRTFPHVSLMLRRTEESLPSHEQRYFPLTGVSYLVIRVTPRVSSLRPTRKPIRMSHVQRLEDVLKTSLGCEVGSADGTNVVKTLAGLAKDLGIGSASAGRREQASVGGYSSAGDRPPS